VTWPFDPSRPVVTPEENAEYLRTRAGLSEAEWALPSTLAATFQTQSWRHIASRCDLAEAGPGPMVQPLRGQIQGASIAAARMMIGAPAAAITMENAIVRGVRNVLVVGSAGSLRQDLTIGSAVVVSGAEREDGTSHHYLPMGEVVEADPALSDRIDNHAHARGLSPIRGRAWTIDAPFRETAAAVRRHRDAGVLVVEMEAAAMFAVARVRGVRAALIVSISDELGTPDWRPGFDDRRYLDTLVSAADAVLDCALELLRA
jgi:purine-nucleoside phosphorylase